MKELIKAFDRAKRASGERLRQVTNPALWGNPPQAGLVKGKYLQRTGACNQCGKCCTNIYLVHEDDTIKTVEDFERFKRIDEEFEGFLPLETDEHGVRFQCKHLLPENRCGIYQNRPSFCRQYPSERGVLLGGTLAEGCGYSFEVLKKFNKVLAETAEKQEIP